jgi:hypothetical protein
MVKSILVNRKKRGRPATGRNPVSAVRLPAVVTAAIDMWAANNGSLSRSDAIRRLVEKALAAGNDDHGKKPSGGAEARGKRVSKASDMAGKQIDDMADKSATDEERQTRKRRLLKGPTEFRDMRSIRSRPKS